MSYSMKRGGKEVGPAAVYAPPHDMKGRPGARMTQPMGEEVVKDLRATVGNISTSGFPAVKTSGIKMRGGGAATKGTMSRGPMG